MADRLHVPFIIYLGENELKNGSVTLKDLNVGRQLESTFEKAVEIIALGVSKK
jgi:histidyl-tRNA synthetase